MERNFELRKQEKVAIPALTKKRFYKFTNLKKVKRSSKNGKEEIWNRFE